jgi:hypothetical protein
MADNTIVHIGENSPEQVALKLLEVVANLEGRALYGSGKNAADRKWVLDTYHECLQSVRGVRRLQQ